MVPMTNPYWSFIRWLQQDGPTSSKYYVHWSHPVITFALFYAVIICVVFYVHDAVVPIYCSNYVRRYNRDEDNGHANDYEPQTESMRPTTTQVNDSREHETPKTIFSTIIFNPLDTYDQGCEQHRCFHHDQLPSDSNSASRNHQQRQRLVMYSSFLLGYVGLFVFGYRMYQYNNPPRPPPSSSPKSQASPVPVTGSNKNSMYHPKLKYVVFYEFQFMCNVTLLVSPLALLSDRLLIPISFCVVVGIDQLLWYVDLFGYFIWYVKAAYACW